MAVDHTNLSATPRQGTGAFVSALAMLLVLGALGVATIVDMFDGPGTARQERTGATPALPRDLGTIKAFPGAAKHYAAQRYALKEIFIALNTQVKRSLFGHSPYPRVMFGKGETLFLGDEGAVASVQGVAAAVLASDAAWTRLIVQMDQAFTRRGIPFVHLIAPDKHTVLSKDLPDWVQPTDVARVSRILDALPPDQTRPVDLARLFAAQLRDDPVTPLYHPTDTHWTEYGAALAIDAGLSPYLAPEIAEVPHKMSFVVENGGDLSRMIGLQAAITAEVPQIARPPALSCTAAMGEPVEIISLDPLPTRRFTCRNPDAAVGHALVFMDSFGMAAAPRLAQIFQQVDFIWSDVVDMREVDRIAPDLVLRIMVGRKLQNVDAAGLLIESP